MQTHSKSVPPELFPLMPVTVIKLGGSLFDLPQFHVQLLSFLEEQYFRHPVLLPGGGEFADVVRRFDQMYRLGDVVSHELGVRTLSLSSRLIAGLSPRFALATNSESLHEGWNRELFPVFDATEITLEHSQLPASWEVTSDSVAAWLASLHPQSELVFLKSVPLPSGISANEAARKGLVDGYFPILANTLQNVTWCNFRENGPQLKLWVR